MVNKVINIHPQVASRLIAMLARELGKGSGFVRQINSLSFDKPLSKSNEDSYQTKIRKNERF